MLIVSCNVFRRQKIGFLKKCFRCFKFHGLEVAPTGLANVPSLLPSIKNAIIDYPERMSKYAETYNT